MSRPATSILTVTLNPALHIATSVERVEPGVPSILPPLPPDAPDNRLGLAQWLVDPRG